MAETAADEAAIAVETAADEDSTHKQTSEVIKTSEVFLLTNHNENLIIRSVGYQL